MNPKRRILTIALAFLASILALWLLPVRAQNTDNTSAGKPTQNQSADNSPPSSAPNGEATATPTPRELGQREMDRRAEERRKEIVRAVTNSLSTPISFYGRIIDQHGDPVADADINFKATDNFMASGTGYQGKSDADGYFSLTHVKGAALGVGVRKKGYYQIYGQSNAYFAYGVGVDSDRRAPPTKDAPALFILHKMGETVPLFKLKKDILISRKGDPVEVSLQSWKSPEMGQGDIRVEAWTEDEDRNLKERYNWRCRISVPGGGLVERIGEFNFEAPEEGYQPYMEISMSADAERWQPQGEKDYFIVLPNGSYGRLSFHMIAGGTHYFQFESHLNPSPGDRNLEADPDKLIEIRPR